MAEYVVVDKEQLEADITTVADAIREKGGTSEQLPFPNGMADAVRGIQSGGGEDLMQYVVDFRSMFSNVEFPTDSVLDLNLKNLGKKINTSGNYAEFDYVFQSANGLKKIICRTPNENVRVSMYQTFNRTTATEIDLSEFPVLIYSATQTFYYNSSVEIIKGTLRFADDMKNVANMFGYASKLKEVRFEENNIRLSIVFASCKLLSNESIQSIIDGLADLTGQTAQTITWHKDIEAKLSEEQKAQITSKNWTIAFQ